MYHRAEMGLDCNAMNTFPDIWDVRRHGCPFCVVPKEWLDTLTRTYPGECDACHSEHGCDMSDCKWTDGAF